MKKSKNLTDIAESFQKDPSQNVDFLKKASKATKKILKTISSSFEPQKLHREFNTESDIDESKLLTYQSKLPQLIELISFKAIEFKMTFLFDLLFLVINLFTNH